MIRRWCHALCEDVNGFPCWVRWLAWGWLVWEVGTW